MNLGQHGGRSMLAGSILHVGVGKEAREIIVSPNFCYIRLDNVSFLYLYAVENDDMGL